MTLPRALLKVAGVLVLTNDLSAAQADIGERRNRLSFNYDALFYDIGLKRGLGTELNYDRFLPGNFSLPVFVSYNFYSQFAHDETDLALGLGIKRFFFGRYQRLSLAPMLVYARNSIDDGFSIRTNEAILIPIMKGYTWQWSKVSTGVEAGGGPGWFSGSYTGSNKKWSFGLAMHWGLNVGFLF